MKASGKAFRAWLARTIISLTLALPLASADEGPLRVGAILPLTGKGSSIGTAIRNGMQLALEELTPASRRSLSVRFEDDGSETMKAVSAFKHLLADDHLEVVVSAFANAGHAIVPLSEQAGVLHFSISVDPSISLGRKRTYTVWVNQLALAKAAVLEMEKRNYRRVAISISTHEGNIAMREAFLEAAANRFTTAISLEAPLDDFDLNTLALKIKSAQPLDCIANLMHPAQVGRLVMALQRVGVTTPHFALGHFEDLSIRQAVGKQLAGSWYPAAKYSPGFVERYQSRFPGDSIYGAAYGHDVIVILSAALTRGARGDSLITFLRELPAIPGTAVSSLSSDGNSSFAIPVEIRVVGEDGIAGIS